MNSEIILCKNIKMDRNYNNVLNYTEEQMVSLCRQNQIASADDYSFLRSTGSIWVGFTYNQCLQANYIAFQNKDYSNKWFFAWIDDVIYKNDRNVEIRFTIDAWSTWFSKVTTKKCFINRQHVTDDTIGLHTIDENLRVQEVVQEGTAIEDNSYKSYIWVAIETAWVPNDNSTDGGNQFSGITVINRSISGTPIVLFKIRSESQYVSLDYLNIALFIIRTARDNHIADISNIFILPDAAIDETKTNLHTTQSSLPGGETRNFNFWTLSNTYSNIEIEQTISKNRSFGSFVPKNNKVYCYPYNYLFVSNNIGAQNIYKYEDFSSENCTFKNQLAINIGCSGRLVPTNYKGMELADDESLPLAKYPTCSWSSDAFTNWLSEQAVNQASNLAFGIFGAGQNYSNSLNTINTNNRKVAETGTEMSSLGADVSLALNISGMIANQIGNFYIGELMPNIKGGTNTGDVNFASDRNCFTFRKMHAKEEFLRIVDDYFTKYGYKINKLELPNINGRTYWNYIEIASTEEIGYGEVPSLFMEEINNACRKGVTIWHNHTNIGNYDLDNSII